LQFPAAIGGVVPVFNLPGIGPGQLRLTGPLLGEIFWDVLSAGTIRALPRSIRG
jgi:ABC-type phosphate transport system substrate-binding protein